MFTEHQSSISIMKKFMMPANVIPSALASADSMHLAQQAVREQLERFIKVYGQKDQASRRGSSGHRHRSSTPDQAGSNPVGGTRRKYMPFSSDTELRLECLRLAVNFATWDEGAPDEDDELTVARAEAYYTFASTSEPKTTSL